MASGRAKLTGQPELTGQQRRAVSARDVSVALSAGAGCGKTFVLTERFLAHLDPQAPGGPARLSQLLAITFTERAAREMRQRIRAACRRRLIEAPEEQAGYWRELIRDLDSARISTIHSFCGSLLRGHAVEAGLDPHFRVLDQAQADTLLFELSNARLRARLAENDETAIDLVVRFGLERLREMIGRLLAARQEIDWRRWREETPEMLVARWEEFWREDTIPRLRERVLRLPATQTVLRIAEQRPTSNTVMQERLDELRRLLAELPNDEKLADVLASVAETARVQGGGGKTAWQSEPVYNEFRDAAKDLRDTIKKIQPLLGFDAEAALDCAATALSVLGLAGAVSGEYQRRKEELSALDFNDLMIRTKELLADPARAWLRKQLGSRIKLLLVDEFQDTDPLQVELVRSLCNDEIVGGKLFFVGDFKQSIYRFRGARPHVFRELRRAMPEAGRLPLSLNFRSQPEVLRFVNRLFAEELGPEYEPLQAHRPQVTATPAIEFICAVPEEPGPRAGQQRRMRQLEADWIARRIRNMLDAEENIVFQDGATRAVRPGDVALLFRALSNVDCYEDALQRHGIDYYLVGGHAFYSQQEIFDLLNLLRSLASVNDEVAIAGVLRSPMFCLEDETIFWLTRHEDGLAAGLSAGSSALELPLELGEEQRRRVKAAAETLAWLRHNKDRLPIAQLISEAMARSGYDAVLLSEFLGQRKLANMHKLIDQARSFDRSGIFTLADFILQLSQFVVRQPDEALAATHPESTDVVRLMTIHQSKGLEFPVVVVPDVDRKSRSSSGSIEFSPRLGPMIGSEEQDVASGYDLQALVESDENRNELARLFYVATTRAADYLILSAGMPKADSSAGPWRELLLQRFPNAALGGAVESGGAGEDGDIQIAVTTSEPPVETKPSGKAVRRDLRKIVEKARQMAAKGQGHVPPHLDPVLPDPQGRRQFSFSRISGKLHTFQGDVHGDAEGSSPLESRIDPRGLGSLVHKALAQVDFAASGDVAGLVRRLAPRELPSASEGQLAEPIELIERFLSCPRAEELAAAVELYPELEFLLSWPPGGGANGASAGKYLQGFIDCIYKDAAGGWHVLDYKTNRGVTPQTLADVAAPYEMQMLVYALAAERILGGPPVELVLHFLRPGLEYEFQLNDQSRRRVIELVGRAIS